MPRLTISAAARLCHCDRRTLQRAIHSGRLHLDAEQRLSTEELLLAGYLVADTPQEAPQATPYMETVVSLLQQLLGVVEDLRQDVRALCRHLDTPQATPWTMSLVAPQETPRGTPRVPPRPRRRPLTSSPHPRPQSMVPGYDLDAALARMQALQAQGYSLTQIAAQLTAEGITTRHGKPWHRGTVGYLLQHRRQDEP
jgi:hypothetical protein